jgi:hypothetical protein
MRDNIKFLTFIISAHLKTHCNFGLKPSNGEFGKKVFEYQDKGLIYRNEFFNQSGIFIGQEAVLEPYSDGALFDAKVLYYPIWSMAYEGVCIPQSQIPEEEVQKFLMKVLRRACFDPSNNLIRGLKNFNYGDFQYHNEFSGTPLSRFTGKEFIYYKGNLVYQGSYAGANIE